MPTRRPEQLLLAVIAALVAVGLLRSGWAQVALAGPVRSEVVGARFLHLVGRVPADARVGFCSDLPEGGGWRRRELTQLRYVLSPARVAEDDGTQRWVVQRCAHPPCPAPPGRIVDRQEAVSLVERVP